MAKDNVEALIDNSIEIHSQDVCEESPPIINRGFLGPEMSAHLYRMNL